MGQRYKKQMVHREMTGPEKVIGFLLVLFLIIFIYLSSPFSRISDVVFLTHGDVNNETIQKSAKLVKNDLFFMPVFFPGIINEPILAQHEKIKSIQYQLNEANQLLVTVEEYSVIATVTNEQFGKVILSNGKVLEEFYDKYSGSVTDIAWRGSDENLVHFASEFAKVDDAVRILIESGVYDNENKMSTTLFMRDGNQTIINFTNFASKINYYDKLVKETNQRGIFDLSVGIFFTPFR